MTEFLVQNAWLLPSLPLLGGAIVAVGGRWLGGRSHLPVVIGIGLAFVVSLFLLAGVGGAATPNRFDWIEVAGLAVPIQFRVDGLTTMMLSMVTFVATLVAIYAAGYMAGDPAYPRFFAVVGLFVGSMTGLVLSDNYVLTYACWEGVGVCSYLLVGFWHTKPVVAAAAKKAFMVNRLGDIGFAIGLFWLWSVTKDHDLSYGSVFDPGNAIAHADRLGIVALFFWAATAKSAQIPLYVWLPDAMEGPTPVSALIHAATMVTAGVYLVARSTPLIVGLPELQVVVSVVGALTALLAALIALTQTDLKRVMAYSTISQLGYMFMGLGAGVGNLAHFAVIGAMFHLFTHAFFKALLFLASGSVMHSMGGIIDMRRFGGLRHKMPYTCWTFAAGALALSGLPIFAGFWSKDEILGALHLASTESGSLGGAYPALYTIVYWISITTAGLTAFYTGRAFFLTFFGPEKLPSPSDPEADPGEAADAAHGHGSGHEGHLGHESPPLMWIPLVILAVCAALVGLVFGPTEWFTHHVERTPGLEAPEGFHHAFDWFTATVSTTVVVIGLGLSYAFYALRSPVPAGLAARLGPLYRASLNKFYIDEFYDATAIRITRFLAATAEILDIVVVERLVIVVAWIPRVFGRYVLAPFQNGLIQFYAGVTALGVAGLLFLFLAMSR